MGTDAPDEPTLDPRLEDEVTPDVLRGPDGDPPDPDEPTPGSDNDGPDKNYTPPEDLPPRSHGRRRDRGASPVRAAERPTGIEPA